MAADIRIEGRGVYVITAITEAGHQWMQFNIDETISDEGGGKSKAYSDDTKYTLDIAEAATEDDLTVAVNGKRYLAGGLAGEAL